MVNGSDIYLFSNFGVGPIGKHLLIELVCSLLYNNNDNNLDQINGLRFKL